MTTPLASTGIIQRNEAACAVPLVRHDNIEHHTALYAIVAVKKAVKNTEVTYLGLGHIADPAEIYSEQRYPACRGISRRAKHRAVAAEYHGEIGHRRDIADLDTAAARGKDIAYLLGITAVAVLCLIRNQYNIFYLHRIPP